MLGQGIVGGGRTRRIFWIARESLYLETEFKFAIGGAIAAGVREMLTKATKPSVDGKITT